jgi:hypothetical protein
MYRFRAMQFTHIKFFIPYPRSSIPWLPSPHHRESNTVEYQHSPNQAAISASQPSQPLQNRQTHNLHTCRISCPHTRKLCLRPMSFESKVTGVRRPRRIEGYSTSLGIQPRSFKPMGVRMVSWSLRRLFGWLMTKGIRGRIYLVSCDTAQHTLPATRRASEICSCRKCFCC